MVGHDCDGDDVSFPYHSEPADIGEAELKTAHYVADNLPVDLCNYESLGTALVNLHEKIRAVILRQTDPVDLDNGSKVIRPKWP